MSSIIINNGPVLILTDESVDATRGILGELRTAGGALQIFRDHYSLALTDEQITRLTVPDINVPIEFEDSLLLIGGLANAYIAFIQALGTNEEALDVVVSERYHAQVRELQRGTLIGFIKAKQALKTA